MKPRLINPVSSIARMAERALFARKLKKYFSGKDYCFISSNCLGGRFSKILNQAYRSPTVGLYLEPADFLSFLQDLPRNLAADIAADEKASALAGYPVGIINGIKIWMMHYASFAEARKKWDARKSRVDLSEVFLIFTDRDGATYEHLQAFDRLPFKRKLVFVHRPYPDIRSAVYVEGFEAAGQVGELYHEWHRLNRALSAQKLQECAT